MWKSCAGRYGRPSVLTVADCAIYLRSSLDGGSFRDPGVSGQLRLQALTVLVQYHTPGGPRAQTRDNVAACPQARVTLIKVRVTSYCSVVKVQGTLCTPHEEALSLISSFQRSPPEGFLSGIGVLSRTLFLLGRSFHFFAMAYNTPFFPVLVYNYCGVIYFLACTI